MLGQLNDAGNTVTLAHYLRLLGTAFLVTGLELFSAGQGRKRGSSPKLVFWNNALISAPGSLPFQGALSDGSWWGRLVENAVGAHLLNELEGAEWEISYWRDGSAEVDYVVRRGSKVWALEVKSGRGGRISGLALFQRRYPKSEAWLIEENGIALEEFFDRPPSNLFR